MKRRFMSKNVMPRKVLLAGLFAFCMSFFGFSTQAEAQAKAYIPQDVAAMQTLITDFEAKQGTITPALKLEYYTEVNEFYKAVVADVQGGMVYRQALASNKDLLPATATNGQNGGSNTSGLQQLSPVTGPK